MLTAHPLFFWFFLILIPLILLYFIRERKKELPVASTLLWKQSLEKNTSLFKKFRKNLFLLFHILMISLAILTAVTPLYKSRAGKRIICIADASFSMNATESGIKRKERAGAIMEKILSDCEYAALIVSGTPEIPDFESPSVVMGAYNKITFSKISDDFYPEIRIAKLLQNKYSESEIHLFTDSAPSRLYAGVVVHTCTEGDDLSNIAITGVSVSSGINLFLNIELSNFSEKPVSGTILYFHNDVWIEDKKFTCSGQNIFSFPVLNTEGVHQFNLSVSDCLEEDNTISLTIPKIRLLISGNNPNLLRACRLNSSLEITSASLKKDVSQDYDLYIFDDILPDTIPSCSLLFFPPEKTEKIYRNIHLEGFDSFMPAELNSFARDIHFSVCSDPGENTGVPVFSAESFSPVRYNNHSHTIYAGFSLTQTNLCISPVFPVFIDCCIQELSRSSARYKNLSLNPLSRQESMLTSKKLPDKQNLSDTHGYKNLTPYVILFLLIISSLEWYAFTVTEEI